MDKLYYDAFISYRHTEMDSFVAQKMHKMLERYRIPKKIQEKSGKKKITRIFRDQEELPLSADLSENITTALQHSEFLILICSPEAMESRWVRTEIETFLQTHSKDRVLTVLVKGEPEESFPEILCYRDKVITENGVEKIVQVPIEPLAADVRGASKAEVEKKLKNEVLRILAPMLSCSYDELRQRHREYKLKCTIGIVSVILCLAIAFSVYAMRQAAAIEEQYQNSRKNQARYLCNISDELLKSGDRVAALQTALALQTKDGKEALVPEQMYALNNALYSYQYDSSIYLNPDRKLEMENSVKSLYPEYAVSFSPEGSYIFTLDILGKASFFDSVTGEVLFSTSAKEQNLTEKETFISGIAVSEKEAILLTDRTLLLFDIAEQKLLNHFAADAAEEFVTFYNPRCEIFGEYLAVRDSNDFYVYHYKTGEVIYKRENLYYEEIVDFEVSPSQKQIALSVKKDEYGSDENDYFKLELYSLEHAETISWDISAYEELKLSYVDEEHLAVMWIPISGPDQLLETYRSYCYGVYDLRSQKMIWQDEGVGVFADYSKFQLMTENMYRSWERPEEEPMLLISIINQLKVVNAMTGEMISHSESKGNIVGVQRLDETRVLIASENGELFVNAVSVNGNLISTTKIDTSLNAFYYHPDTATGAVVLASDGGVVLCRAFQDQSMNAAGVYASAVSYMRTDENEYRGLNLYMGNSEKEESAILWNLATEEEVLTVKAETNAQKLELLECLTINGEDCVMYSLVSKDYKTAPKQIHLVNISTGEKLYQMTLENIPSHTGDYYKDRYDEDLLFAYSEASQMAAIYLKNENYFEIMDCKTGKIVVPYQEIINKDEFGYTSLYGVEASKDGKYFVFAGKLNEGYEKADQCYLKLWNIEQQCWEMISEKETCIIDQEGCTAEDIYTENLLIGTESMQMIIYPETDEIFVVNILTGEVTQTIPFHGKNRFRFKFFDDEKYLLLYGDEGHLMMWDLQQQKMTMKDTELLEYVTGIYTDESSRYFGLASNTGAYSHVFNIYYVDEESRFYHYADIQNGFARFSAEEAFNFGSNGQSYFTKFYDYETLKEKAEKVIGDNQLTDTERKMYYLAEE